MLRRLDLFILDKNIVPIAEILQDNHRINNYRLAQLFLATSILLVLLGAWYFFFEPHARLFDWLSGLVLTIYLLMDGLAGLVLAIRLLRTQERGGIPIPPEDLRDGKSVIVQARRTWLLLSCFTIFIALFGGFTEYSFEVTCSGMLVELVGLYFLSCPPHWPNEKETPELVPESA